MTRELGFTLSAEAAVNRLPLLLRGRARPGIRRLVLQSVLAAIGEEDLLHAPVRISCISSACEPQHGSVPPDLVILCELETDRGHEPSVAGNQLLGDFELN